MSTRFYPRFARGNPQLRVFLPNFWMKLMRPTYPLPPNKVQFACSMQMSKYDVKNYLTQIYKIPVVDVHVWVHSGKTKKNVIGYVIKEDDVKMARVTMPKDQTFEFPNIHENEESKKEKEDEQKTLEEMKENFNRYKKSASNRQNLPPWFSI